MQLCLITLSYLVFHLDKLRALPNDTLMRLLYLANRRGVVTEAQLFEYFARQNPVSEAPSNPHVYAGAFFLLAVYIVRRALLTFVAVMGPFRSGGFDVNMPPPRFDLGSNPDVPFQSQNYVDRHTLNVALYIFAHQPREMCGPLKEHLVRLYWNNFHEAITWGAEEFWDVAQSFGFGQAPESPFETSLLMFFSRFRVLPRLENVSSWLEFHQLSYSTYSMFFGNGLSDCFWFSCRS